MIQTMKYLVKNRYRYFKCFFKTFAPVLVIIITFLGVSIYTNRYSLIKMVIIYRDVFTQYRLYVFTAIAFFFTMSCSFGSKPSIYIYHATLHFFYSTEYLSKLIFCMYLKKLLGCIIISLVISSLLTNTLVKLVFFCISITVYIFLISILKWFKFNSQQKAKWIIICFIASLLFIFLKERYFLIGSLGLFGCFFYTKYLRIDYVKWMEECAFVDEAAFASAKKDLSRMYHVQSIAKSKKLQHFSYPLWKLRRCNNITQKTVIRFFREPKRMWVIWSIPFVLVFLLKLFAVRMPYLRFIQGLATCFFLSGINQYLYNDFFELLNKAKNGLFLPYSPSLIVAQGLVVPAIIFFVLAATLFLFVGINISQTLILFIGWMSSFTVLLCYRIFRKNPSKFIIAIQNTIVVGLTLWMVI